MAVAVRDAKGRLVPGHPRLNNLPGHCGGAKKCLSTEIKDALKLAEDALPDIIAVMIKKALAGDTRAGEYLCDRIYGKPNQPLSNKDGSKLQSFTFALPVGFMPSPGGMFGGSNTGTNTN